VEQIILLAPEWYGNRKDKVVGIQHLNKWIFDQVHFEHQLTAYCSTDNKSA